MTQADILIERLIEHSGLHVPNAQLTGVSFAERAWIAQREGREIDLEPAVRDIIDCLDLINKQRRRASTQVPYPLPGRLVYAVSGLEALCLHWLLALLKGEAKRFEVLESLLTVLWRINCAWDALVAGDIDDIPQHVQWEANARGIQI